MKRKARILFHEDDDRLLMDDAWGAVSAELLRHLEDEPPHVRGDTHLAKFYRRDGSAFGMLENGMPGSTFSNFEFERHQFGDGDDAVTVIVGWYW